MTESYRTDPVRIFQVNGEVCKLLSAFQVVPVAGNNTLVAAVAGKVIRVMGWNAQSNGAVGSINFKDGSGGTTLHAVNTPANTAGDSDKQPIVECGYFETSSGVGLFGDCGTTAQLLTIFYITYTP
jgi:hypothetical protein